MSQLNFELNSSSQDLNVAEQDIVSTLTPTTKMVYQALKEIPLEKGKSVIDSLSINDIAERGDFSASNLNKYLKDICEKGLIEYTPGTKLTYPVIFFKYPNRLYQMPSQNIQHSEKSEADVDLSLLFFKNIKNALRTGRAFLSDKNGYAPHGIEQECGWKDGKPQGIKIGFISGNRIYLEPQASYQIANEISKRISFHKLGAILAENNCLVKYEKGKNVLKMRFSKDGVAVQGYFYAINMNKLISSPQKMVESFAPQKIASGENRDSAQTDKSSKPVDMNKMYTPIDSAIDFIYFEHIWNILLEMNNKNSLQNFTEGELKPRFIALLEYGLGYTGINHNEFFLHVEPKTPNVSNPDSKSKSRPDACLGWFCGYDKSKSVVKVVIEIKGPETKWDDKITGYGSADYETAEGQILKYLNDCHEAEYGIITNFRQTRIYYKNQNSHNPADRLYLEFNLNDCKSKEDTRKIFNLLSKDNLLGKSRTETSHFDLKLMKWVADEAKRKKFEEMDIDSRRNKPDIFSNNF